MDFEDSEQVLRRWRAAAPGAGGGGRGPGAAAVGGITPYRAAGAGTTVLAVDPRDAPDHHDDWVAVMASELPAAGAAAWAVLPSCGAVVSFSGTSRDHSGDRTGVTVLEYEAYDEEVVPRLQAVAAELRRRWPGVGRVALLHRLGEVAVGEASVVVVVSAPHRDEAFAAARFGIDALKSTVPIWKREVWSDGSAWGLDAHPIADLATFGEGGSV
jgi:molybdopterin synthase catalytic subunit